MSNQFFNERFRQVLLLLLILLIAFLLIIELTIFIPGILGAITVYILTRNSYAKMVNALRWNKGLSAALMLLISLIIIAIPVWLSIELLIPKIELIAAKQNSLITGLEIIIQQIEAKTKISLLTADNTKNIAEKIVGVIPKLLNSSLIMLTNLIMMLFMYYYLLVSGKKAETFLKTIIPLKPENVRLLAHETKMMIRANALGIPLICVVQGIFAALGYWIFGISDWALWGFFTGLFAFFPLVGTMIIWVPLVAYMYASGNSFAAFWLMLYSFIITGNVDYVARITLMKKIGDVHPLITVLGVIVGLNLFGFIGLIFGPLLVSYFIILVKIYINEFAVINSIENK
jgi:predicted PurR-regulated permease PerM